MSKSEIEIRQLKSKDFELFKDFFARIDQEHEKEFFNPHPFTDYQAKKLCEYQGEDEYYVLTVKGEIVGYGMLRGWDEGFEIPSIGLHIHKDFRSIGLGSLMMNFLHIVAKLRRASHVRIKVQKDNRIAKKLYDRFGYEFSEKTGDYLIGYCEV